MYNLWRLLGLMLDFTSAFLPKEALETESAQSDIFSRNPNSVYLEFTDEFSRDIGVLSLPKMHNQCNAQYSRRSHHPFGMFIRSYCCH